MICNEWINTYNTGTNWCMWCKNKMIHVMREWFFFGVYRDGHSSHHPWLNHECKIECLHVCVYVCVCVRVPAGDCTLCMMNSHGYMSHPLWPWVLLTLWHEYVLEAIAVGAYLCHTVCIVTAVWLSWFMSPSEVGFPVYVSHINVFKCLEGLWLILAWARWHALYT